MNGKTYYDTIEVTFVVPAHITSRKERLDQAYEYLMDSYLGHNPSKDKVTENLNLQNLQNDDTYKDYSIVSTWKSTNKSVIKDDGTVIRPDYDKNVTLNLEMFYARDIVDEPTAWLLDPGPLDDCEIKESIIVTVKGTLGEKEPEPEPEPEPSEEEKLLQQGIHITDDAMVVETLMRHPVKLTEGSYQNIKITTPEELAIAEAFLRY